MQIRTATEQDKALIYALRVEVFVCEQNVPPEIELDSEDAHALHFIAEEGGAAVGCGRMLLNGTDAHIGRLAVKKNCRGMGIGAAVCRFMIDYCIAHGYKMVWLNSQLHAVGFYERLGFKPVGEEFEEAGIRHIRMERYL